MLLGIARPAVSVGMGNHWTETEVLERSGFNCIELIKPIFFITSTSDKHVKMIPVKTGEYSSWQELGQVSTFAEHFINSFTFSSLAPLSVSKEII